MERGHEIKVLDCGYVRLVDWMGSDEAIVEAARMSTGRGFVSWEPYKRCKKCDFVVSDNDKQGYAHMQLARRQLGCEHDWQDFLRGDLGMLDFMYRNRHSTPFEFGELHVEVQAPLMVFREWHRHRTQSYSEFSARYSQMPNLHYTPDASRMQTQGTTNRQGSGEAVPAREAADMVAGIREEQAAIYQHYEDLIDNGLAKEIARLNTPVSRYSKMRAKTDLRNWLAFLQLRMAPNAQWEIRQYACAVAEMVKALWPRTYALFEEYDLFSVRLSRTEVVALAKLYRGELVTQHRDVAAMLEKIAKASS